ncbi:MAG: 50S ribosomal protein L21e [Candidatus Aenigmarchaeota archaeon]|nr:50S ribosomal protein L21e [Candidatus Aenigmarchaeota archaeon]
MRASKGFRRDTRRKLKKKLREKFKPEDYVRQFAVGDRVMIKIDSASQKGMPFPKFMGLAGKVTGKRGRAYIVSIKDRNKEKTIISRVEHLRPLK